MLDKLALLLKIEEAKRDMLRAEADLERALGATEVAPRAEKTTISAALEKSFADVRAARARLGEVEALIAASGDD